MAEGFTSGIKISYYRSRTCCPPIISFFLYLVAYSSLLQVNNFLLMLLFYLFGFNIPSCLGNDFKFIAIVSQTLRGTNAFQDETTPKRQKGITLAMKIFFI